MTPFFAFINKLQLIGGGLAVLFIAACAPKEPTGQVLATVNGNEVTTRDLQAELTATGQTPSPQVDKSALDVIITRSLLADEGRRLGLDQSPNYLALLQRGRESLLGSQTLASWARTLPTPSSAESQAYITSHPLEFHDRRFINLEQIVTGPAILSEDVLRPLKTIAQVAAALQAHGITSDRRKSMLDTAQAPAAVVKQLLADSSGEPAVERVGNHFVFSAVSAVYPAPPPPSSWFALANEQLKRLVLQQRVVSLRKSATVKVQALPPF